MTISTPAIVPPDSNHRPDAHSGTCTVCGAEGASASDSCFANVCRRWNGNPCIKRSVIMFAVSAKEHRKASGSCGDCGLPIVWGLGHCMEHPCVLDGQAQCACGCTFCSIVRTNNTQIQREFAFRRFKSRGASKELVEALLLALEDAARLCDAEAVKSILAKLDEARGR
jgi:hypothetical protein